MTEENTKIVPNYGNDKHAKLLNMPQLIANMKMGQNVTRGICFGAKIAAMNAVESFVNENGVEQMNKTLPLFNLKQSVVPEMCEAVTSILPLDNENVLVGTGESENNLHIVNMKKVREANYKFKKSCEKPEGPRLSRPETENSVMDLTKLLPRTEQVQWKGGVKGLSMNKDGTMIACSSRNAKDLTVLGFDKSKKWTEECKEMNEMMNRQENRTPIYNCFEVIIRGWHKHPTLPNEFEDEIDHFGIFTRGGLLKRFAHGQCHTRTITDTCWIGDEQVVSVGDDGYIILWDLDGEKSVEEREQWPTQILSVSITGIAKISSRLHLKEVFRTPGALQNRAKIVGINKIGETGKIVTSTSKGRVHIMNGVSAVGSDVWKLPKSYLPISFLPEIKVIIAQDVHQTTGEVIVATPYHMMFIDHRQSKPTGVVRVYDCGDLGQLKNGPVTKINAECGFIIVGHKSGNLNLFDRRMCKIVKDKDEVYNIEPSWLYDRLEKIPYSPSGPFDIYPVKAISKIKHKTIAGGGPITCNGEFWAMGTLSFFE